MIYYIVARDTANHNEWVHSSWDTAERAAGILETLRKAETNLEYRVDTVDNTQREKNLDAIQEQLAAGPITRRVANRDSLNEWRRTAPYPIEESRGEFTLTELFGWYDGRGAVNLKECSECGAAVSNLETHRVWHNKVADL